MKRYYILINSVILICSAVFYLLFLSLFSPMNLEFTKNRMKTMVQIPLSLAENMEKTLRENSGLDRKEIQEEFISTLNVLKYDQSNFFFIVDGRGNLVTFPTKPGLKWWNMLHETDTAGNYIFRDLINKAIKDGEVTIETEWKAKYSDEVMEHQYIYGMYYWPWDWIICTVIYSDEIAARYKVPQLPIILTGVILILGGNISLMILLKKRNNRK